MLAGAIVLFLLCSWIYVKRVTKDPLDLSLFTIEATHSASKIYVMRDGLWEEWEEERILSEHSFEYVPIDEVPRNLINAFVAIEDKRFYEHHGVDWYRSVGAIANYFLHFGGRFGASTITQQLIKNVTGENEQTVERKIREMFWALDLERELTKDEVLELYLNVINLSDNCYGIGAAARRFFSKKVSELSLIECACIAAITNSPAYYNPIKHPENNKERRDLILAQMYEQGYIDAEEFSENHGKDLHLNPDERAVKAGVHSWYVDMVIDDVISDLQSECGLSRERASDMVFGGGLEIYIQIDLEIQKIMEEYYKNSANFTSGEGAESAMIIIDPKNGDVLGVVGAIGEKIGNRIQNYATDTLRPPGSTIKPLSVYAPALERGVINYASVYDDVPYSFENEKPWPKNANGIYHGLSTMSYAMANSTNTVPLKILDDLGLSHSFYFLRDSLHLDSLVERGKNKKGEFITDMDYAALALGQLNYGVSVREISAAYSIFANGGIYHAPRSYSVVKNSKGDVILTNEAKGERVISEENAQIMTKLLSEVVWGGTADGLTVKNKVAVAAKTGTTQDNKDRWCIGYTPSLICGVWYGYEYPREIPRSEKDHFLNAFDTVLNRIYSRDVRSAYADREFYKSSRLITVNYCMDSGLLPSEACFLDPRGDRIRLGYFVKGSEPTSHCKTHIAVEYDAVCGGVATVFTPIGHIERVGLLLIDREFPIQVTVSDAQYVYKRLEDFILPSFEANEPFFAVLSNDEKQKYFGISAGKTQFNRLSTAHFCFSDLFFVRHILR
jgi:penicillin-binding protein 1A